MEKREVFAYVVMEQVSEPMKPMNLKEHKTSNGLLYVEFDSKLQALNRFNRNRRSYTDRLKTDLKAEHILEMQKANSWCGEAGHPDTDQMARIMKIDPQLISHHIPDLWFQGDIVNGKVITLDNGGFGTQMTRNILQNMEPAFSLRALTNLTKRPDGSSVAEGKSFVICYDWVILPSHKEAYRDTSKDLKIVQKEMTKRGNVVTESLVVVTESMIKDYISMDSVNLNLVSDIYEVTKESMELTPDFKNVILREDGRTFHISVEDKIQNDITSYLSKF